MVPKSLVPGPLVPSAALTDRPSHYWHRMHSQDQVWCYTDAPSHLIWMSLVRRLREAIRERKIIIDEALYLVTYSSMFAYHVLCALDKNMVNLIYMLRRSRWLIYKRMCNSPNPKNMMTNTFSFFFIHSVIAWWNNIDELHPARIQLDAIDEEWNDLQRAERNKWVMTDAFSILDSEIKPRRGELLKGALYL